MKEKIQSRKDINLQAREEEQKQKELKKQRRKNKELKALKEEEERKKQLEYIKIKEWEEKFDREQKAKEHLENLREQKLKQRIHRSTKIDLQFPVPSGLLLFYPLTIFSLLCKNLIIVIKCLKFKCIS